MMMTTTQLFLATVVLEQLGKMMCPCISRRLITFLHSRGHIGNSLLVLDPSDRQHFPGTIAATPPPSPQASF